MPIKYNCMQFCVSIAVLASMDYIWDTLQEIDSDNIEISNKMLVN